MLISYLLKKLPKNLCKKIISGKVTKNGAFDFYNCDQKFLAYTFWGAFAFISADSNSASNFLFHETHVKFLKKNFANFLAKIG
jgi:hypothetical protein